MTAPAHTPQGDADTVLVAGVMRSGQTWLCFMLAHALNARFLEPYCLLRGIVYSGHDYVRGLANGSQPGRAATRCALVVKTHETPDPHYSLTRKLVLIVRDPRDTATSAALRYHVMATTGSDVEEDAQALSLLARAAAKPPTLKDRLASLVYGNRLLAIIMVARKWRNFHHAWLQIPFCHIVRFEDLVARPVETMAGICRYLEVDVTEAQLRDTVHRLSMAEIKKHGHTDEAKGIGFRKGVVGDFKNHLSALELRIIRHYCRPSAARFGYEL
jgi:hypothetical protein